MNKITKKRSILVVDDIPDSIHIIREILKKNYQVLAAINGETALKIASGDQKPDVILLDIMMPKMDGFEVCKRLKENRETSEIPVVFVTASDNKDDIAKGLELGAYYYLTKPVDPDTLLAVTFAALEEQDSVQRLKQEIQNTANTLGLLVSGLFRYRSIDEANQLAVFIAKVCPNPRERSIGLRELMINAVEHGNLGITYDEKSHLNKHGIWKDEVTRRQQLSEYKDKAVTVDLRRTDKDVTITIADEGEGFDWTRYLKYDPERLFDSHGRGIAMANAQSFDALEYQGKGNVVKAVIHLTERSVSNPFD